MNKYIEALKDEIKMRENFIKKQSSFYLQYEDRGQTSIEIRLMKYLIKLFQQIDAGISTKVKREVK